MPNTKIIACGPTTLVDWGTLIDIPGGGSIPTGTGYTHQTVGVTDAASVTPAVTVGATAYIPASKA